MAKSDSQTAFDIVMADDLFKNQMLDQIPVPVIAVDQNRVITYINQAGQDLLGLPAGEIYGKVCAEVFGTEHCGTESCCMQKAITQGKLFTARNVVAAKGLKIPVEYTAVPLYGADSKIIGGLEYFVDITERVQYEDRLREQNFTIRQMSTPTIKLWEGVLVLPIVGVIDSMRAQNMMETMLQRITETSAKVIILDIQGVAAVDTAVANHLIKITKATRLMGCQCIISGISPAVAQTIVQLGIEMADFSTKANLSDALSAAFDQLNLTVIKRPRT